jgi:hypothetical protein
LFEFGSTARFVQLQDATRGRVRHRPQIGERDLGDRDRREAGHMLLKARRFDQNGGADAVDPHAARQLDGRGLHEALHKVVDRGPDGAAVNELIGQNTGAERE